VSEADLFVVCKSCGSEVSQYVTECPYCGNRVRKRAPKIARGEEDELALRRKRRKVKPPRLPKLRSDEIPGIAPETKPYATGLLVVLSLLATLVLASGEVFINDLGGIIGPLDGEWWRIAAHPFVYDNFGTEFIALVAIGIFGTLLERRFGWFGVIAIFLAAAAAGGALTEVLEVYPALTANGAALGLLTAWFVDDRLAARRGDDRGNDLLGVAVIFVVLMLVPLADETASWAAGLGGAAAGAVLGALVSPLRR
jgi:membrane associated rhomboid family serine protease/DNA-directed RNA polymerase subunit RPC12/RpoP